MLRCNACKKEVSILSGSLFFKSKLKFPDLLLFVYCCSIDMLKSQVMNKIEWNSKRVVSKWYKKLQHFSNKLLNPETYLKIGGNCHIIQIDESLFF